MRSTTIAMAALALGLTGLTVHAADLPPAPILDESGDETTGWYLRGDLGVVDKIVTGRDQALRFDDVLPLIKSRFGRDLVLSGGVGYRFASWLRADVTVDHRFDAAFRGTRFSPLGFAQERTDFEATTFLVNGYIDLPFWDGMTPYLGAGIGVSANRFDGGHRLVAVPGVAELVPLRSRTQNAFAWALMAGMAFDITSNLTLDLGYRYTHLGNTRTGLEGTEVPLRAKAVAAHELRIGARYQFD